MDIRYEDDSIIVVRKPVGIESQSGKTFAPDMVSMLKKELYLRTGKPDPYIAVVHRLDRNVEGIMVYAKTKSAAAELSRQVQKHEMRKQYKALLLEKPQNISGTLTDWLVTDKKNNFTKVGSKQDSGAQQAILHYEIHKYEGGAPFANIPLTKEEQEGAWIADIQLITGRHHQIRVQFANANMPLWGDCKYNPNFIGKKNILRIGLCAWGLSFRHPTSGTMLHMTLE